MKPSCRSSTSGVNATSCSMSWKMVYSRSLCFALLHAIRFVKPAFCLLCRSPLRILKSLANAGCGRCWKSICAPVTTSPRLSPDPQNTFRNPNRPFINALSVAMSSAGKACLLLLRKADVDFFQRFSCLVAASLIAFGSCIQITASSGSCAKKTCCPAASSSCRSGTITASASRSTLNWSCGSKRRTLSTVSPYSSMR